MSTRTILIVDDDPMIRKLIATTLSGALMGMAGAPFPYYIGYLEPASAFGLPYAVNSIAMPMIRLNPPNVGSANRSSAASVMRSTRSHPVPRRLRF